MTIKTLYMLKDKNTNDVMASTTNSEQVWELLHDYPECYVDFMNCEDIPIDYFDMEELI